MVCAMQELSTTAVAITEHQQHHHQLTQMQQQHQQHQQQQVEIVRTMPTQFLTTNAGSQRHQNHHPQHQQQQLTTIVLLTTPAALQNNGQPTQFQQQQQQTVINVQQQQQQEQQQQQKLLNNKSQQLKKQHASLVRLLESAPITQKPLIQKQTQNTSPLQQQQQQIVIPQLQQQQIIYVQQHPQQQQQQHQQLAQQLAQPRRLKISSSLSSATLSLTTTTSPLKQSHHQQQLVVLPPTTTNISDNSNIIKTLNTSNHNISTITPINQEQDKPQQQQDLQQPQQHPQHHLENNKEQDLPRLKHDNESGIDEDREDDNKQRKLEKSLTESIYEPQQCPWKKIRYARELKQKEQMQIQIQQKQQEIKDDSQSGKCDNLNDKQHNNTTSNNNIINNNNNSNTSSQYELNLAEQTHKEIAILLQQQHQNYQQQQLQQQQQQHQHRRDSSDSNSSLISNTSSTHSLSNGCTCTPQQLQLQRDSNDDDIYHDQEQQHQNYSRRLTSRRSLTHEEEQHECQCVECHLDNMDDSGCDDDQKEEEQSTLNYLCQKFDENLETGKHQNQQQTTDLDKVAILIKKDEEQQQQEMEANNNNEQQSQTAKQHKEEGFFRRSIQQKIQYRPCTKNQQCSILRINRNRCQYCRLKKCIAVGMSRDAVRFGRVPKREKARILAAMQQSTQNRGQQRALSGELDDQPRLLSAVLRAHLETCEFTKEKVAAMRQRARECPSYSMPTLLACPLNPAPELQSEQEFSQRFAHVIRGVIDFAGMIPGFQLLSQDDKFTLLKAGLFDALFVRLICMFDNSINSIICLNGQVMRRDAIQNGANARFLVDSTFNFAERMNSMNLTDAEIGLFCAIVLITPDRPGLRNIELIEKMYSRLKGCLQTIINQNRPEQPEFMNKLLETMPDLRTLSTLHTEKLVVFRTEHKELLRQQMWSMEDEQPALSKSPNSWEDHRMDVEAKSPLGSVSSTESGDLEYQTATTTTSSTTSHLINHHSQQTSSLASSAPLLAATLSGSCPIRNRANSGSSGDSTNDLDIVGSHAHLTQNGLTITPIVRAHSHQQLHHHLTAGTAQHRYRKLDSPTDSGIESGNEKTECGSKNVSSGGSSSCSSPRSSVDDALDCTDSGNNATTSQVTVSVSPVRSPQPLTQQASSTSSSTPATMATLKRQIVDDMPVLKRVLQAPPLYDTNSLMDEAYKPHKKFRALRHREYDCADGDASSSTNIPNAATSPQHHNNAQSPPPANSSNTTTQQQQHQQQQQVLMVPQATHSPQLAPLASSPPAIAQHQSQLHMHLTRPTPTNSQQQQPTQQSSLSSTHSVLAKSLMAEPRMTPEQIKRQDIIQNYIMRDSPNNTSLLVCSPHGPGSRSPAPQHLQMHNLYNGSNSPNSSTSPNSNCNSPSTTTTTGSSTHIINALASPPVNNQQTAAQQRWSGHSVITTTTINQRQQSVSPSSNGSSSSSTSSIASSSSSTTGCQYFQSPHSTSASVSPPRPSPSTMNTPPRLLELQVDIADSQQPLNLSKKSPTPPPSKLQALVAAATAAQRYPTVSADVTVTATTQQAANTTTQVQKVMLEA